MEHGTLWGYLGSFIAYTLLSIAFIYGVFLYLKRNPAGIMTLGKKSVHFKQQQQLLIEERLPLEARKNLYIVRSGTERFLIATSLEGTQFLSRLEPGEPLPVVSKEEERGVPQLSQDIPSFQQRLLASLKMISNHRFLMKTPEAREIP